MFVSHVLVPVRCYLFQAGLKISKPNQHIVAQWDNKKPAKAGHCSILNRLLRNWPSWPEAAYLGFWWNIYGPTCPSAFLMYSTTSSAGNLNPRPSDTRSTLIGYFGLLGFMATILNISPRALKVRA
ncbi:MAG: hypothetical protein ACI9ND_002326 [Yoonia sp.]|jgi:hypothetical protein